MSVIIRLQNLPLTASAMDIRVFFHGLSIPDGGVHIVGGKDGDAFIAFSSDEDARQAMNLSGEKLKDSKIKLLLSSRSEMCKVIEEARQGPSGSDDQAPIISATSHTNLHNGTIPSSLADNRGSSVNNPPNTLDPSSNQSHNNSLPNMTPMGHAFPPGLNPMGLPHANNPFAQKLSPQQMNPFMAGGGGSGMPGFFPINPNNPTIGQPMGQSQPNMGQQPPNPFMVPNLPFGHNPMTFPGILPGMGMLPGMMPGMNQQLPNQMTHLPSPFNSTATGIRLGGPGPGPHPGNQNNFVRGQAQGQGLLQAGGHQPSQPGNGQMPVLGRPFSQDVENFGRNSRFSQNQNLDGPPKSAQAQQHPLLPVFNRPNNPTTAPNSVVSDSARDRPNPRDQIRGDRDSRERDRERDDKIVSGRRSAEVEKRSNTKLGERRRKSRSRSRDRERSRRRSRSRSPSRSRSDRGSLGDRPSSTGNRRRSTRSNSRDYSFGDSDSRNVSASDQDLIIDEPELIQSAADAACVMMTNVPNEATYRDVREFLRADVRLYGVMRDFEKGTACIRLDNPSDLERVARNSGRKLHGQAVRVEIVPLQVFEQQAKKHGKPVTPRNREAERDFPEREQRSNRDFDREGGGRNRDGRQRDDHRDGNRDGNRESRRHNRAPDECCLIIQGLPVTFSGADVANVTLDGVIKNHYSDIHIHEEPMDRQGRQFATAFVKFFSVEEAELAIVIIKKTQDHLHAYVTDIEELQKIRQGIIPSSPGRRMPNETKPLFDIDMDMESCNVMLRGIPLTMTERDISDFFSDVGLIPKRVKFLTDAQTGNRIAKCICEFNDIGQARTAVTKDGHFFGRNVIGVRILPPRDSPSGPRNPGPGHGPPAGPAHHHGNNRPSPTFVPPGQNPQYQPLQDNENPFVRALNASVGVAPPMPRMSPVEQHQPPPRGDNIRGGMRGRGAGRGGRGGVRQSRFAPADSTTNDHNNHNNEQQGQGHNPPQYFDRKGCVLALTNIPFSANMDQIIQFLEETLEKQVPNDRIIRRYNEFQKPTGDARVAFSNHFETKQAYEKLQGSRMWGRLLDVSVLSDF